MNMNLICVPILFFLSAQTLFLWYKSNIHEMIFQSYHRLNTDDRFVLVDHSLLIKNVTEQDQGIYHCNVLPANITMKAKLVLYTPLEARIYDQNGREISGRSITYDENNRIEVECRALGGKRNKIDFKWSADGNRLVSNDNLKINGGKLIIERAQYDHVRDYQCLADDGIDGVSHATFSVNVRCKWWCNAQCLSFSSFLPPWLQFNHSYFLC